MRDQSNILNIKRECNTKPIAYKFPSKEKDKERVPRIPVPRATLRTRTLTRTWNIISFSSSGSRSTTNVAIPDPNQRNQSGLVSHVIHINDVNDGDVDDFDDGDVGDVDVSGDVDDVGDDGDVNDGDVDDFDDGDDGGGDVDDGGDDVDDVDDVGDDVDDGDVGGDDVGDDGDVGGDDVGDDDGDGDVGDDDGVCIIADLIESNPNEIHVLDYRERIQSIKRDNENIITSLEPPSYIYFPGFEKEYLKSVYLMGKFEPKEIRNYSAQLYYPLDSQTVNLKINRVEHNRIQVLFWQRIIDIFIPYIEFFIRIYYSPPSGEDSFNNILLAELEEYPQPLAAISSIHASNDLLGDIVDSNIPSPPSSSKEIREVFGMIICNQYYPPYYIQSDPSGYRVTGISDPIIYSNTLRDNKVIQLKGYFPKVLMKVEFFFYINQSFFHSSIFPHQPSDNNNKNNNILECNIGGNNNGLIPWALLEEDIKEIFVSVRVNYSSSYFPSYLPPQYK